MFVSFFSLLSIFSKARRRSPTLLQCVLEQSSWIDKECQLRNTNEEKLQQIEHLQFSGGKFLASLGKGET